MPAPPQSLCIVAVVGAGPLAVAFVHRCLTAGLQVVLEDVLPANLRSASAALASSHAAADRLTTASTVEDAVRQADLAVDFVPDELESKLEIFSMVDRMAPPRTILCTPTAALSIADLASCTYRPERCFALRHLPSALASTAERPASQSVHLIAPPAADPAVQQALTDLLQRLGLSPEPHPDSAEPQLTRNL